MQVQNAQCVKKICGSLTFRRELRRANDTTDAAFEEVKVFRGETLRRVTYLQLGKKLEDFRLAPINCANKFPAHHAVTFDDVGLRIFKGAIEVVGFLCGIANRQQFYFVVGDEPMVSALVGIHTDSKHRDTTITQFLLQLNQ